MFRAALLSFAVVTAFAGEAAKPATNTKDPVCRMPVTAKSMTVAVRGREYRVCGKDCAEALQKNPDKYLEKDGSVKAEKK